jgi:hypothetical protein
MPPTSPAAYAAARRLLSGAGAFAASGDPGDGPGPVGLAERTSTDVATALARWFGPYGYHALLTRALTSARSAHPALASVSIRAPLEPVLDGLADAAETFGIPPVLDGVAAVLAAVLDLLGRMIGEDMALHLVERLMDGSQTNAANQPTPTVAPTGEGAP